MATKLPNNSFYRRTLPPTCVALSAPQGKKQFASALQHKGLKSFFALMEQFTTQSEPAFCGISSLVMVLNSLAVDPRQLWKGPWRWYHEDMLNCCLDLEEVKKVGITLNLFSCLARCQGLQVEKHFAQDCTLEIFREAVNRSCVETGDDEKEDDINPLLVVSYNRKVLQQTGTGHFSPVAAFDQASDQILILDTARFKYGAHWVPLSLLFDAMLPVDPDTKKSRGYILLSYKQESDDIQRLHTSILVKSTTANNSIRKNYKHLLDVKKTDGCTEMEWEDVRQYWTEEGENTSFVWKTLEPQIMPVDEQACEAVDAVLSLVRALIPCTGYKNMSSENDEYKCRERSNRLIALSFEEAIYIVYLASLSPDICRERIFTAGDSFIADDATKKQLLLEAKLVREAIETSDEMEEALKEVKFSCNCE